MSKNTTTTTTTTQTARRKHNKSHSDILALLKYNDTQIETFNTILQTRVVHEWTHTFESPCLLTKATDGRFSHQGKKICYGYHITAFCEHGRSVMEKVATSKYSDSITISHLCGNPRCIRKGHHILEAKKINDQRTHCHFVLKNIAKKGGYESVARFESKFRSWCPHAPQCGLRRETQTQTVYYDDGEIIFSYDEEKDIIVSETVAHILSNDQQMHSDSDADADADEDEMDVGDV